MRDTGSGSERRRIELLLELGESEVHRTPRTALARGIEALELVGDSEGALAVRAYVLAGSAHHGLGSFPAAIEDLSEALTRQRRLEPAGVGEAAVLLRLADAYRQVGDLARSLKLVDAACSIAAAEGDDGLRGEGLAIRGALWQKEAKPGEALECYEEALQIGRVERDLALEMRASIGVSQLEAQSGSPECALERLEWVVAQSRKAGHAALMFTSLLTLQQVHHRIARGPEMPRYAEEVRHAAHEIGARFQEAEANRVLHVACRFRGERDLALQHAEQAAKLLETTGARLAHATMLSGLGDLLLEMGDAERARGVLDRVLAVSTECGSPYGQFQAHASIGKIHMMRGEHEAAKQSARHALAAAEETNDDRWICAAHELVADAHEATGDLARALTAYRSFAETRIRALQAASGARLDMLRVRHELAQARRVAEDARRRQRAFLEQTPHIAMHAYDEQGTLRIWNRAAETMYGWTEDERAGKTAEDMFLVPQDYATFEAALAKVARGSAVPDPVEWRFRAKDESTGIAYTTLIPLVDVDGDALVVRMDLDVTAHRMALDDLRRSEARNRSILDSLHAHVAVLDASGRIIAVNERWVQFGLAAGAPAGDVGVGADYLANCRSAACAGSADAQHALVGIEEVLSGSHARFDFEYECSSPSEEQWYRMSVTPFESAEGGVVISHEEVTDRKRAERQRETALAEVSALKDRLEAENVYLTQEIQRERDFSEIVGSSAPLEQTFELVNRVAATDVTVLLHGETGTGKELFARAIHAQSSRKDHSMIKVDCASLPGGLIESELLGHERGAFTGAEAAKPGRFELADGGTIFLDEIGELPLELQAKLLRVLQDGEFERLGSATVRKVDVRVVAATNRDLSQAVSRGSFRSDLYYRLNGFPIELPPLRLREGDVSLLVWHFIRKNQERLGTCIEQVPRRTMEALESYSWPGNVRELFGVVERAMILSSGRTLSDPALPRVDSEARDGTLEEAERTHILNVLEACGWRIKGVGNAADRLGLPPSTLRHRMKRLGVRRPGS